MKANSSWTAKYRNKKEIFKMKKIASIFMVFTLLLSLAACSSNTNNTGTSSASQSSQPNSSQTVGSDDSSTDSEKPLPRNRKLRRPARNRWLSIFRGLAILKMLQSRSRAKQILIFLKSYLPRRTATIMMLLWIWRRQNKAKTPGLRLQTALKILRTMM